MQAAPLIEADELARHIGAPDWVVVDCRFDLLAPERGYAEYLDGHVPGARYAHLDRDLARPHGPNEGRHPLPEPARFAERLGAWGIDRHSVVVAYDAQSGAIAARLWWLLGWLGHERRRLLNGGFPAWQRLGLPIERELPQVTERTYALEAKSIRHELVVDANAIAALQRGGSRLVDARAAPRYRGEQEPIDPVAGHVPGALNRPFTTNLGPDGRFRSDAELRAELAPLVSGGAPEQLVAMCGSGVTACHLLVALAAAGLGEGRLFAGSWSEWIADPTRPIRTGSEA